MIRDPKRELAALYRATATPRLHDAPPVLSLAIDGVGDPDGEEFAAAVTALYSVSYGLRFAAKKRGEPVWTVMPLEALWSGDDPALLAEVQAVRAHGASFTPQARAAWKWTALIVQPDVVTASDVDEQVAGARRKGIAAAEHLRLEQVSEGRVAQILHVGPYATEPATVVTLHAFIAAQDLVPAGPHHEIYLSDPRRTAPEKARTILRQPVAPAAMP